MASPAAYWCTSAAVQEADGLRTYALGGCFLASAEAALRWLHIRLAHIAEQLDPPVADRVGRQLFDSERNAAHLAELRNGRHIEVHLEQERVRYTVAVRSLHGPPPGPAGGRAPAGARRPSVLAPPE